MTGTYQNGVSGLGVREVSAMESERLSRHAGQSQGLRFCRMNRLPYALAGYWRSIGHW